MTAIGNGHLETGAVSVRVQGEGNLGAKPRSEVVTEIRRPIKEWRA